MAGADDQSAAVAAFSIQQWDRQDQQRVDGRRPAQGGPEDAFAEDSYPPIPAWGQSSFRSAHEADAAAQRAAVGRPFMERALSPGPSAK